MKIQTYSICNPVKGICKQDAIWGKEYSVSSPIVYLQRPKWITNDDCWQRIIDSIRLSLPHDFEIT